MPDQDESPKLEDLTPEEANRIIHTHRKVRYGTACWPCRQRKVKCDNKSPCDNCVRREHAQLCSYKPNKSAASKSASVSSDYPTAHATRKREHSPDEQGRRSHSRDDAAAQDADIRVYGNEPDSADGTRYLGQNSIPALLREQANPYEQQRGVDTIRQDMRSILGLDNTAPFPLMSGRHLDKMTQDIAAELPSDREVMKLFRTYKEIPQQFWGFIIDIDDLESKLMVYLEERAKNARVSPKVTKPVSASWLAILFAVLAVGSQYHDSPYHVRTRDAQKYIQISFHFLRVGNFLLRPNFDSLQALLMTGFVLLNDMKAEASWALLGLTCRLAQSLGLHRSQTLDGHENPDIRKRDLIRRKIWWTCVWHDTLTSLSFDRSPMTNIPCCPLPLSPNADRDGWVYLEVMMELCRLIAQRLNPEAVVTANYAQILENCQVIEDLRTRVVPQLRSKEACKTALDRLQYYAIRLHTSFVVSVCCRPALRRGESDRLDAEQKKFLADKCKANLTETVRMFLAMHQLSVIPTRSWAFTYHGLSSAVLLGILCETQADPEVRQLQGDLISALSATAAKEQTSPEPPVYRSDRDIELSGPLSRALTALKNIYDHGSVVGSAVKLENGSHSHPGSGARTPQPSSHPLPSINGTLAANTPQESVYRGGSQPVLDPHQNAALAMAELQQQHTPGVAPGAPGVAPMHDFANGIPYVASMQQPAPLQDLSNIDPTTYMSPMDLYDSIFWESPDPFNTEVDSMNFDFLAQPPPGQPQQQYYF
ncbi:hypothetical protein VTK73DRAFT_1515 [Phialemonium thermophilum]|uniref:Zn(2)-C6 fungal-type domain-containing protein n=1 Tax=Phialemonium thermophilum TaxID=223376 RepID=A0ABR3X9T2_9PEZI